MNNRQRKQIHLKNFDYGGGNHIYFITICTAGSRPYFLNEMIAKLLIDELDFRKRANEINLFCYCVMPDHLHILISLTDIYQKSLQNWVAAYKRYISKAAIELFDIKPLWQKNFYEHIVRESESLLKISEYIINNPVRKGLVDEWRNYPFSGIVDPLPI